LQWALEKKFAIRKQGTENTREFELKKKLRPRQEGREDVKKRVGGKEPMTILTRVGTI